MNYYKVILCALLIASSDSIAMQQLVEHSAGQSPFERLPKDIHALILEKLVSINPYISSRSPYCNHNFKENCTCCQFHREHQKKQQDTYKKNALANIRNLTNASKTLRKLRADKTISGNIIQELSKSHFKKNLIEAAYALGTESAYQWLQERRTLSFDDYDTIMQDALATLHLLLTHTSDRTKKIIFLLNAFPQLINAADSNDNTLLMYSTKNNTTLKLIARKADITAKNKNGETFINHFIKHAQARMHQEDVSNLEEIIKAIPEAHKKYVLNEPDNNGDTPVINCIRGGCHFCTDYRATLKSLLKHGANPSVQNSSGKAALEIAYKKTYQWLLDRSCIAFFWNTILLFHSDSYMNILWKYNPDNKWKIFYKCNPYTVYSAAAAITFGIGLAGYAIGSTLSSYFNGTLNK